jgi:uncharacterized membrane protein
VTTFKVVPRGTEGAVSIEGTLAGIVASTFLAGVGYILGQVNKFMELCNVKSFFNDLTVTKLACALSLLCLFSHSPMCIDDYGTHTSGSDVHQ